MPVCSICGKTSIYFFEDGNGNIICLDCRPEYTNPNTQESDTHGKETEDSTGQPQ